MANQIETGKPKKSVCVQFDKFIVFVILSLEINPSGWLQIESFMKSIHIIQHFLNSV